MISHKEWKDYKKKHDIPDGVCDKVNIGKVLDTYDKSDKADADLKKLETAINWYTAAAKRVGLNKVIAYLNNAINSEIAAPQEIAANQPVAKPVLSEAGAKRNRGLATTLTKHHANVAGLTKLIETHADWFAKTADDATKAKRDKLTEGLQAELNKLFAFCRDEGGDTVDISLTFFNRLGNVANMAHAERVEKLKECNEMVKETTNHLADKL